MHRQQAEIKHQQKSLDELSAQVTENKRARNLFEFQEKCAEQARKTFSDLGYKQRPAAAYENHYNENLNKCFIEITDNGREPTRSDLYFQDGV